MIKKLIIVLLVGLFLAPLSAFAQFDRNLSYGMKGDDVGQLQEFLTSENLYFGPITGNFYSLTLKAVKAFQSREGIKPVAGFFGVITRGRANDILSADIQASNDQAIGEGSPIISPDPTPTPIITPTPVPVTKTTDDVVSSINDLKNQITQQNQTISQQQQALNQIAQNTAPTPSPTLIPTPTPLPTTISIKNLGGSADKMFFLITNNGPDAIRIKSLNFKYFTPVVFQSAGIGYNFTPETFASHEIGVNETVTVQYADFTDYAANYNNSVLIGSGPQSLRYVPGSIMDISTGNDIVFSDFNF